MKQLIEHWDVAILVLVYLVVQVLVWIKYWS
jgi:hypothetical protein